MPTYHATCDNGYFVGFNLHGLTQPTAQRSESNSNGNGILLGIVRGITIANFEILPLEL
jgi:hypothetical protein